MPATAWVPCQAKGLRLTCFTTPALRSRPSPTQRFSDATYRERLPRRGYCHTLAAAAAAATATAVGAAIDVSAASLSGSVCIVGAGVIGLTSALRIKQALPGAAVMVVADRFDADTTSFGAGGLWKPFTLGGTPPELVNRWGKETFDHYMALYQSPQAPAAGTILTSAYQLFTERVPDPDWAPIVPGFRHLSAAELAAYDCEGTHAHGWFYTTIITEGRFYLAWLAQQLAEAGVQVVARRVNSLTELTGHDVVVNCAGLGARELCSDESLYPVRGHVLRVRAPWIRHYTNSQGPDGDCYIIPNLDTVVLGGTVQKGDSDMTPREVDRRGILERACHVLPSLAAAEVVGEWVGLRPGRPSVRLELEELPLTPHQQGVPLALAQQQQQQQQQQQEDVPLAQEQQQQPQIPPCLQQQQQQQKEVPLAQEQRQQQQQQPEMPPPPPMQQEQQQAVGGGGGSSSEGGSSRGRSSLSVVHNYGHGGAGLTLAWGCAADAAQLVQQALARARHLETH